MLVRGLFLFSVLFFFGCSTPTAYISSLTDPNYKPTKSEPTFILVPDGATLEERRFASFLRKEMQAAGFMITDDWSKSRYIMMFQTGQKTSQINTTAYFPQTQTTSGYVNETHFSQDTTSTVAVPVSRDYTVKTVFLKLYATSDVVNKKFKTIWEGYIGAGKNDYNQYTKELLHLLFDVYGTDYQQHTPIRMIEAKKNLESNHGGN